jgi:hypothetical protein
MMYQVSAAYNDRGHGWFGICLQISLVWKMQVDLTHVLKRPFESLQLSSM